MTHTSVSEMQSRAIPGVMFCLRRISFGRRLQLARLLQDRLEAIAKLALTPESPSRDAETALLAAEIDETHLRWGLAKIEGLDIDGAPATADSLIDAGPEELVKEILAAIRHETGLDAEERKNFAPPSTSCAGDPPTPGRAMRGSAENACAAASTSNVTAGGISPNCSSAIPRESYGDGAIHEIA
jgi:hypothetical protein